MTELVKNEADVMPNCVCRIIAAGTMGWMDS